HPTLSRSETEFFLARVLRDRPGAADVLHREERNKRAVVIVRPDLVDLRDRRVLEPGEQRRLLLETPERGGSHDLAAQGFDRDGPLRVLLFRLVDDAHAARSEDTQDPISADRSRKG